MAHVVLAGGAAIDLATSEDAERHHSELLRRLVRPQVRARRIPGFLQTPATVTRAPIILLNPKSPPPGALWVVQWIRTQAGDPGTAVANVTMIGYIGSSGAQNPLVTATGTAGDDVNAFTNALATPSLTNLPDKVVVYPTEEVYFLIAGTAVNIGAAAKYGVVCGVLEVPNSPEALTWI